MENLPAKSDSNFLEVIERLSSNQDVDVSKIEKIIEMQERILDRNAKQSFNAAMVNAQSEMPLVPRDKENLQTKSKYSKYETILNFVKPIYTRHGFSISFYECETNKEGNIRVCADVMHNQGYTKMYWTDIPLDDKGVKGTVNKTETHAKGSSLTYGKSYLLRMIFNIPTGDDDDGNAAGTEYITEDQQIEIQDKINEMYSDGGKKFLDWIKVDSVESIPAKDYKKTINSLKEIARKKR